MKENKYKLSVPKVFLALSSVLLIIVYPAVANKYIVFVMVLALVNIIMAISVNLIIGYTGQVSLGQAAFLAVGAYTTAILSGMLNWPFPIVIFLSGIVAALLGFVAGLPALRLRGLYLAVSTLAFHTIIKYIVSNAKTLGGSGGVLVGRPVMWGGFSLDSQLGVYYVGLVTSALCYIAIKNMLAGKEGRAFISVRDQELVASALGVETARYKLKAFVTSSFVLGVGGSLYGFNIQFIDPDHFTLELAIIAIGMAVVGGMGTVNGPVMGGLFFTVVPEVIRHIRTFLTNIVPGIAGHFEDIYVIVNGLTIVLFLIFLPGGLVGILDYVNRAFRKKKRG
jgi:branched-chain amino acid transport system permease protein